MAARFSPAALARAALLGFGFYLQYVKGLEPCPLCLVQRGFFVAVMAVCLIAALHRPRRAGAAVYAVLAALFALGGAAVAGGGGRVPRPPRAGAAVYAVLAALFALGGAAVAGRQVWLQHLPPDKVPQCGPDLFFMVENFPLSRT